MKRPEDEPTPLSLRIEFALLVALMLLPMGSCAIHAASELLPEGFQEDVRTIIQPLLPAPTNAPDVRAQ